ncbi:hypothetical protein DIURU_005453 [Diutina rugosa]|uniref:Glutathione synthetase n=1 Tax=Diutina rugosa TaxID=5481 RepID=A0A642UH41_DIURU|nr:uncharacterized protein DIURU_005453 [Diutina rugosa]KAA8896940.1 hypothetical protein DIURU_005453 [Diutina rugosa]
MTNPPFPTLSQQNRDLLVEALLQWSLGNGLTMYPPGYESLHVVANAPVTLFPTPIPKSAFNAAIAVQQPFNQVYANVVSKKQWLVDVIKVLGAHDPEFTGRLFETYQKSLVDGKPVQRVSLGLFRSDYMVDTETNSIKQIEFNTVSVSFGGLSTKVGQLHNYLNSQGFYDDNYSYEYYNKDVIPVSPSTVELARGLAKANEKYGELTKPDNETVVLFVVQPNERNCFDQRHVEYALLNEFGVKSVRVTFNELATKTSVREDRLYVKSTMDQVSVVYYRSGYGPEEYGSEIEWEGRLKAEKTLAIKCPSILTQLSGAKKVQQELTNPEILAKFIEDSEAIEKVQSTFVNIYPMDDSEAGLKAREWAQDSQQCLKFVLKPQREGGGNNVYKEDIPKFLEKLPKEEWEAYILMELINPQQHPNSVIRNSEVFSETILSELGIFGTVLFNEEDGDIYHNEGAGFLLRSKFSSSNEGGVAAGFGCVDTVCLTE